VKQRSTEWQGARAAAVTCYCARWQVAGFAAVMLCCRALLSNSLARRRCCVLPLHEACTAYVSKQGPCLPLRPKAGRAACWPVVLRPAGQLYHHHVGSYECVWVVGELQSMHVDPLGAFFARSHTLQGVQLWA
jgi:hypothetical protein